MLYFAFGHGDTVRLRGTAFGYVGDTTLYAGRSTDIPGPADIPKGDERLLRQGLETLGKGSFDRAIEIFGEVARRQPGLADAYYLEASTRLRRGARGDSARAMGLLARGLAADPGHPWLLLLQARHLARAGKPDSARVSLEKILDFAPTFPDAYEELARLEFQRDSLAAANRLARLAISLRRGEPGSRYDLLAEIYFAAEKDDTARLIVEQGLKADSKEPRYYWLRGLLSEAQGDTAAARRDYEYAQKLNLPEAGQALKTLGFKAIHGRGRFGSSECSDVSQADLAIDILTPLSRTFPQSAPLWFALGRAYHARALYAVANDMFATAMRLDSTVPGLREWQRRNLGDLETKVRAFRRAAPEPEKAPTAADNSWYDLGHYKVPWGVPMSSFLARFSADRFEKVDSETLKETRVAWGIRHTIVARFAGGGLSSIQAEMRDTGRSSIDIFEEAIRLNVLQAGSGEFLESKVCLPWGQTEAVAWTTQDTYEFMAYAGKRSKRVGLIRLPKEKTPEAGFCASVALALDSLP